MKKNALLINLTGLFFILLSFVSNGIQAQTVINHDIGSGNLIIQGTSTDHYYVTGTTNTYRIIVGSGYNGTITLSDVIMTSSGTATFAAACGNGTNIVTTGSCMAIMGQNRASSLVPSPNLAPVTKVNLVLEGYNELVYLSNSQYCAIQVDEGAMIHISASDPNDNSSGELVAKATTYVPGSGSISQAGAAIGSINQGAYNNVQGNSVMSGTACTTFNDTAGGNIIISSGTITAYGGHGAGIGGGFRVYYNGIIVVYGGIIEARGNFDAAGIGSGCPLGTGVIDCYADNSTVVALPPAQITAYGAGLNSGGGVGTNQFAELGLTGALNITYLNDLNKTLITVFTEDTLRNADIYLDLTQTPNLVNVFTTLGINYDLTKVRVGRTGAVTGMLDFRAEFQQNTTFFTDASSINPATLGRPYMPEIRTIMGNAANRDTVILLLLPTDISFIDFPSIPLEVGYTTPEALDHAFRTKLIYNDAVPMTSVTFVLQDGIDFSSLIFLAADSLTVISPPTTLNSGDTIYIIFPVDDGKPLGVYSDVLLIHGDYGGIPLPGYIRKIGMQRVIFDDSFDNDYIRVTANPNQFTTMYPTTNTVDLTLNIDHTGTGVLYDYLDVVAMYLVTPIANYSAALATNPLYSSGWQTMNVPLLNNGNATTTIDFSTMPAGTYYIHWYVESGVVYAHSLDVTDPPRLYGGFGPYTMMNIKAVDDFVQVIKNGFALIPVKDNDILISSCTSIIPTVTTPPLNGTATIQGDSILYKPALDYVGNDSMIYRLVCSGDTSYAKVRIRVIEAPDNIADADCLLPAESTVWGIRETPMNVTKLIHNYGPLITGDIDNDGIVEIIGLMPKTGNQNQYDSDGFRIFYFENDQVRFKKDIPFVGHTVASLGSFAMARYNGVGYIVAYGIDHRLYAYNAVTNARIWQSVVLQANAANSHVNIADFNNDGIPEVYCGNQIFSLPTGALLCSGGSDNKGAFRGDLAATNDTGCSTMAADVDGDGKLELFAGTQIYQVDIPQGATTAGAGTMSVISDMQLPTGSLPANAHQDGMTVVADIDDDGKLEVVVISRIAVGANARAVAYVWKPMPGNASHLLGSYLVPAMNGANSIPMIGKIDDCPYPEIVFITNGQNPIGTNYWYMYALRYEPSNALGSRIQLKWTMPHTDGSSGCTGMTLFDFNLDGVNEIVYRDETQLRIIDGTTTTPYARATFNNVLSGTLRELPVIADVDGDGQAEIIIQGYDGVARTVEGLVASSQNGYLRVFKSNGSRWAPTRKVWNQYNYNAVNINNDLTVPQYQLNPATLFAGPDSILGTSDDIRPYNGFLVQQTLIDKYGIPVWLAPDLTFVQSASNVAIDGDSVLFTLTISNIGESSIGSPIHYTLYKESCTYTNYIMHDSIPVQLNAPGTITFTFKVAIADCQPAYKLIVRINDKNGLFPFQPECKDENNEIEFSNPALYQLMRKDAVLMPSFAHNGTLANPVSVLYSEYIEYTITAVNASRTNGTVTIRDTLPAYLEYYSSNPSVIPVTVGPRSALEWTIPSLASMATTSVTVVATPQLGAVASQPLFDNRAWVESADTILPTNYTWHQGADVSTVTFSAGFGGSIYQAQEQILDYRTSPRSGIVIAPDVGYRFAGWSHADYMSLRGELIPAQHGIMRYDTLTIYGNVNLQANFEPEKYSITYYLNGGQFPDSKSLNSQLSTLNSQLSTLNSQLPAAYTIESDAITLCAPEKADDVFVGWTGSNGDEPQLTVTIPRGSTGEKIYYANYQLSGREEINIQPTLIPSDDLIWAVQNELFVRTTRAGSILRIYSLDGILQRQQIILQAGETSYKLPSGLYVVTLNNSIGQKIVISE